MEISKRTKQTLRYMAHREYMRAYRYKNQGFTAQAYEAARTAASVCGMNKKYVELAKQLKVMSNEN